MGSRIAESENRRLFYQAVYLTITDLEDDAPIDEGLRPTFPIREELVCYHLALPGMTLRTVGKHFGVTGPRISGIASDAARKCRHPLRYELFMRNLEHLGIRRWYEHRRISRQVSDRNRYFVLKLWHAKWDIERELT